MPTYAISNVKQVGKTDLTILLFFLKVQQQTTAKSQYFSNNKHFYKQRAQKDKGPLWQVEVVFHNHHHMSESIFYWWLCLSWGWSLAETTPKHQVTCNVWPLAAVA